jgi:hypothetical protein
MATSGVDVVITPRVRDLGDRFEVRRTPGCAKPSAWLVSFYDRLWYW